jgi:hypothetical protein
MPHTRQAATLSAAVDALSSRGQHRRRNLKPSYADAWFSGMARLQACFSEADLSDAGGSTVDRTGCMWMTLASTA